MSERPINERDRTLGKLEGKIESLATKDFVREQNAEINRQIAELNRQVAQQIAQQTKELQEAIEGIYIVPIIVSVILGIVGTALTVFLLQLWVGLPNRVVLIS